MPTWWLLAEISADLRGSGSALETCSRRCAIQMAAFTLLYFTLLLLYILNVLEYWVYTAKAVVGLARQDLPELSQDVEMGFTSVERHHKATDDSTKVDVIPGCTARRS